MLGYPRTMQEMIDQLGQEKDCLTYFREIRWPEGYRCPKCNHAKGWSTKEKTTKCSRCKYRVSLFAGTIFQDTRIPLRTWFQAIWWFTHQKTGASALALQQSLGLGSYRTAWTMLHKLRIVMVKPNRDKLSGKVEVDETYIGGPEDLKHTGRGAKTKQMVVIAAEKNGEKTGRIRMKHIVAATAKNLHSFIQENIEPGSTIITDQLNCYVEIKKKGYIHKPMRKPSFWENKGPDAEELLPRVHRVASLLKRWYYGTYQGRIEPRYLTAYLNEFTFRFNRRTSNSRGLLFYRLLENLVLVEPKTYQALKQHHKMLG